MRVKFHSNIIFKVIAYCLHAGGSCTSVAADVVFILDESTSIVYNEGGYSNWYTDILGFAENVTRTICSSQTRVGVIKFSDSTTVGFYLNNYTDCPSVINAISQESIAGGETNIAAALMQTRSLELIV